jgi:hypothetical protein
MYNLNYAPITSGVQSWREIISGGTRTKKVEYHCIKVFWDVRPYWLTNSGPRSGKQYCPHRQCQAVQEDQSTWHNMPKDFKIFISTNCENTKSHDYNKLRSTEPVSGPRFESGPSEHKPCTMLITIQHKIYPYTVSCKICINIIFIHPLVWLWNVVSYFQRGK